MTTKHVLITIAILLAMLLPGCKVAGVDIYDPNTGNRIAHGSILKFGLDTDTKGFKGEMSKDRIKITFDQQSENVTEAIADAAATVKNLSEKVK